MRLIVILGVFVLVAIVLLATLLPSSSTPPPLPTEGFMKITNNTSQDPLLVSLQIDNADDIWVKSGGNGTLGAPVFNDITQNPPNYQLASIPINGSLYVTLRKTGPWRVTPYSPSGQEDVLPVLIECGKDIVCDMSAVSGINYKVKMELSAQSSVLNTIDLVGNPCTGGRGCNNPAVDGDFKVGTAWNDPVPCFAGTCNLQDLSLSWCNIIHTNQCADSNSNWTEGSRATGCETPLKGYTTYCYSHDDTNSSPSLVAPYILMITYSDLF